MSGTYHFLMHLNCLFLFFLLLLFIDLDKTSSVNIVLSCVLASASFIVVALAQHEWQAILGIIFMSICAALGDTTAVVYLTKFIDK